MKERVPVVKTVAEVRSAVADVKETGQTVGFVPTMGAMHAGHTALIDASVRQCDFTVASIFVNPLQFGPGEDFQRYPRDVDADVDTCQRHGVDLIFAPEDKEMYPRGQQKTFVDVTGLTSGLCGASRPGHFRGVTTVVAKLFHIVEPHRAYFGKKDFQQLAVIKRMVEDLHWPVRIVPVETVREADGLALSSRNRYLTRRERRAAAVIPKALSEGRRRLEAGERDAEAIKRVVRRELAREEIVREDYIDIVDATDLKPLKYISGDGVIALAAFVGETRLIDNVTFSAGE